MREDREAGYGVIISPFGGVLNALKLPYRAGHLVRSLGLHIPYIKANILGLGVLVFWDSYDLVGAKL